MKFGVRSQEPGVNTACVVAPDQSVKEAVPSSFDLLSMIDPEGEEVDVLVVGQLAKAISCSVYLWIIAVHTDRQNVFAGVSLRVIAAVALKTAAFLFDGYGVWFEASCNRPGVGFLWLNRQFQSSAKAVWIELKVERLWFSAEKRSGRGSVRWEIGIKENLRRVYPVLRTVFGETS